jgi:hypothetical protein
VRRQARLTLVVILVGTVCFAQDPFSSLGQSAQPISTGPFVTGLIEQAIVVGGILLAFSGRRLGRVSFLAALAALGLLWSMAYSRNTMYN